MSIYHFNYFNLICSFFISNFCAINCYICSIRICLIKVDLFENLCEPVIISVMKIWNATWDIRNEVFSPLLDIFNGLAPSRSQAAHINKKVVEQNLVQFNEHDLTVQCYSQLFCLYIPAQWLPPGQLGSPFVSPSPQVKRWVPSFVSGG
jgi:hypothetical protein